MSSESAPDISTDRERHDDPTSVLTPDVNASATASPPIEGEPPPTVGKLEHVLEEVPAVRSAAILLLLVLAVFYTLYFARSFFLPVVLAVLLHFLFSPFVRALKRARVPEPIGAALVVLAVVGALALGVYELA